jgi:hypothetical protein
MKDNKYLISMKSKLNFTMRMIAIESGIDATSEAEDKAYKKIPKLLKLIDKHLSSDDIDKNADYELYMQCKKLISYWD